jgi:hypothetical protein
LAGTFLDIQIRNTISNLGASESPVSNLLSSWWVIIGIVFVLFGIGFGYAYQEKGKLSKTIAWMIAIYGLGEGLGSGLFKADFVGGTMTWSAIVHDTLGGFGVVAIMILPLVMLRLYSKDQNRSFYIFSYIIFFVGILGTGLFLFRYISGNIFNYYKGIWQRMSLINYYVYLIVIAYKMLQKIQRQ